jgi:hypothetical protein
MKTTHGSKFKLVYSDWHFVGDTLRPIGNGIHPAAKQVIEHIRKNNLNIDYTEFLQHRNERKVIKFDHSELINYFTRNYPQNIVPINEIYDDGFIYIYPLEIKDTLEALVHTNTFILDSETYSWCLTDILPVELLPHFKTGKVKILINMVHDPNYDDVNIRAFELKMNELGIDGENIIILSGCKFDKYYEIHPDSKIKMYTGHLFLQQSSITMKQFPAIGQLGYMSEFVEETDLSSDIIRPHKFLCCNRTMHKPHRSGLAYLTVKYNLLTDGLFSFIQKLPINSLRTIIREVIEEPNEDYITKIVSIVPYELDTQHLPESKKSGFGVSNNKKEWYINTYINIVTETFFGTDVFLSEKVFRPISNYQPFILLGDYGSLKELKRLGFKTFEPFIDESYDMEQNPKKRFKKIEIELAKLKNKSIQEIHDWYYSIKDILVYNRNHLYYYYDGYECFEPIFEQLKIDYELSK